MDRCERGDAAVTTFDQLQASLGFHELPLQTRRELVAAMTPTPSWDAVPDELRKECSDWLIATRPAKSGH